MKVQLFKKAAALLGIASIWGLWILIPVTARAGPGGNKVVFVPPSRGIQANTLHRATVDTVYNLQENQFFTEDGVVNRNPVNPPSYVVIHALSSEGASFPSGATFVPGNPTAGWDTEGQVVMTMNWTSGYCDSGYYEVKWIIEWFTDTTKVQMWYWATIIEGYQVINVNRSPVIDSVTPDSLVRQVGRNVHIQVCAKDLDKQECGDDTLLYSYSSNPAPLITALLSPDGSFDWTPQPSEIGTHHLRFWVTDRNGDSSSSVHATAIAYVCGDLNGDGDQTGADVVMLLLATFVGQEPSAPFEASDLNHDGFRTGSDVVMLLNLTFLGIPADCAP